MRFKKENFAGSKNALWWITGIKCKKLNIQKTTLQRPDLIFQNNFAWAAFWVGKSPAIGTLDISAIWER